MNNKRVVITGYGIVSCIGNNKEEVLSSLQKVKSGISHCNVGAAAAAAAAGAAATAAAHEQQASSSEVLLHSIAKALKRPAIASSLGPAAPGRRRPLGRHRA